MRIKNETKYNTADLKRLFLACCKQVRTGKKIRGNLNVRVIDHKRRLSRANYWGTWALINLGGYMNNKERGTRDWWRAVAWIACHEFLHSRGVSHRKMSSRYSYFYYWSQIDKNPEKMAWADDYPVRLKETKVKPKVDIQIVRYDKVLARIKEWQIKVKRGQNILKKYTAKKRYYEKVLIAAGKLPKEYEKGK